MRVAGLISGTSLDGIDVAIVDIDDDVDFDAAVARAPALAAFETAPYLSDLRSMLDAALPPNAGSTREVCVLNTLVGEAFATALFDVTRRCGINLESIDCIGSHGQTLYHLPADDGVKPFGRSTLQVGEPSVIAARTGITCVADFRVADMAAGGQGAPLVSFVDYAFLRDAKECRAAVNVGGIANLTLLPRDCRKSDVVAFDVGPGNMLIDAFARRATCGASDKDVDGRLSSRGTVNDLLLREMLDHPYYRRRPPKTAGREEFGDHFAQRLWDRGLELGSSPTDLIATVTAATARSIGQAVPSGCDRVILSGGGARNPTLVEMLRSDLATLAPHAALDFSDKFGLPVDAKEAIAFAVLAREAVKGRPNNVPSAIGAHAPVVMGKIAPGPNFARLFAEAIA